MKDEIVECATGSLAVRAAGDEGAPLVICLHGFPDDASTFDGLSASLAEAGHRSVAPYLRGYAPSPLSGELTLGSLVDDLFALADVLSPDRPVFFVGHDYGSQIGYAAMARDAGRFRAAATLAGAHPAIIARNIRRLPRQWWMSRYIVFFQLGGFADRAVQRDDFAYVERLWRRWSPGFEPPPGHLLRVKATLARSMPAPVAMYREGGFDIGEDPIATPTLFIAGARDGCLMPELARGQERLFTGAYAAQTWPDCGHFPHLEQPARAAEAILGWFRAQDDRAG